MKRLLKLFRYIFGGFKQQLYKTIIIPLLALILVKPALSQSSISDKITWVKPTKNIVKDISKTKINKGDTLFVLYAGKKDTFLDSIDSLRSDYHLILFNSGAKDEKKSKYAFDRYREIMNVSKMNVLAHTTDAPYTFAYLKNYTDKINFIVFRGASDPSSYRNEPDNKDHRDIPITRGPITSYFDEEKEDTVYVYNGEFLYDHSGTGQTQVFAECIGEMDCRLFFRLNGRYSYITNNRVLVATTMNTKFTTPIRDWAYENMQYGGDVYTFDVQISKEALKAFSNTEILRFQIGNYLFTATDNIRYGLGKLYESIRSSY